MQSVNSQSSKSPLITFKQFNLQCLNDQYTVGDLKLDQFRISWKIVIPILIVTIIVIWSNRHTNLLDLLVNNKNIQLAETNNSDEDEIVPDIIWPPKNPLHLRNSITGYYNITLPIRIASHRENHKDKIEAYVDYLYALNSIERGQFENQLTLKRLVELDSLVRIGSDQPNYMLYPQAIDLRQTIEAVRRGNSISHRPINNPELFITKLPKTVCNPNERQTKQYDLIVVIKSCVFCFEERSHARQTFMRPHLWSQISIGFIFIIGQPVFENFTYYTFDGYNVAAKNHLPQMHPDEAMKKLDYESEKYGDILIGSFLDTYYNLTLKQIASHRWAVSFCHNLTKLFLLMDHDRSLIPENLIAFVKSIPNRSKSKLIIGIPNRSFEIVHRPLPVDGKVESVDAIAKWFVSEDEIPWRRYAPFVTGPSHLIGIDVIQDTTIAHAFTRYLRFEDVFLGIVLHKLHRIPLAHQGFLPHVGQATNLENVICLPQTEGDRLYDWKAGKPI